MVENDKYEKLVNVLKKLKRHGLVWERMEETGFERERMEEHEFGEYVKHGDILKIIELNKQEED